MTLIFHIIALVLGSSVWGSTYVMYKSEEGDWANRLDALWVHIDDRAQRTKNMAEALFSVVAEKTTGVFNQIVGVKIISPRLVGVSTSLSFACAFLLGALLNFHAFTVIEVLNQHGKRGSVHDAIKLAHSPMFINALALLGLAGGVFELLVFIPIKLKTSRWATWISCLPLVLVFLRLLLVVSFKRFNVRQLGLPAALLFSLASDILLLISTRQSLKWLLSKTTPLRMTTTIVIHSFLIFLVFFVPTFATYVGGLNLLNGAFGGGSIAALALFNVPTAIAAVSFELALLVVLLLRIAWPLLGRLTYVMIRPEVLKKREALRWIASLLILYGLAEPKLGFISRVVEIFRK